MARGLVGVDIGDDAGGRAGSRGRIDLPGIGGSTGDATDGSKRQLADTVSPDPSTITL